MANDHLDFHGKLGQNFEKASTNIFFLQDEISIAEKDY